MKENYGEQQRRDSLDYLRHLDLQPGRHAIVESYILVNKMNDKPQGR